MRELLPTPPMERMVTPATRPSTSLSEEAEPSIWREERRVKACGAYLRRVASAWAVTVASFSRREGDTTVLSAAVPAGAGEESALTAGESGAPAQGTTPARRRGRRYFVGFMPCRFQLAKLKAFVKYRNTHFRVYAVLFLACIRGIFSPFSGFRAGGIPKCSEPRRCLVRDGARRAGDLRVRNESGEVCRKSREELAKSGGLFSKSCGLFGRAPPWANDFVG